MVIPLLSDTWDGQCNARPTVTFPVCTGTKFKVLGDSGLPRIFNPTCTSSDSNVGWYADQDSEHVLSLAVTHATTMLSTQSLVGR